MFECQKYNASDLETWQTQTKILACRWNENRNARKGDLLLLKGPPTAIVVSSVGVAGFRLVECCFWRPKKAPGCSRTPQLRARFWRNAFRPGVVWIHRAYTIWPHCGCPQCGGVSEWRQEVAESKAIKGSRYVERVINVPLVDGSAFYFGARLITDDLCVCI